MNNISIEASSIYHGMPGWIDMKEAEDKLAAALRGDEAAVAYDISRPREGEYNTKGGRTIQTKYDYARQFDEISYEYGKNVLGMLSGTGNPTGGTNVVSDMENKYNEFKQQIIEDYSGKEQEERLADLEKNYQFFMKENVYSPIQLCISVQQTFYKIQSVFANAYEKSAQKNGKAFANRAFMADLSGLKDATEAAQKQIDIMQQMFDKFKKFVEELHDKDKDKIAAADDMAKEIGIGLYGLHKTAATATETISSSESKDVQELWELLNKKNSIYQSIAKNAVSDEEKYKSYLDGKKTADGMERRIQELLEKISE